VLTEGDQVLIASAGGGATATRGGANPERVVEDVEQGFVSASAAREIYDATP
jgi:N-methylhydantoinase B/oxoprolinase/acetone carboxylase alpha subunit